jgi:hypothetical protein
MHWVASEKLRNLVARKKLTCGHVGVLWFLVDHMDGDGLVWLLPSELAATLDRDAAQTAREIKKLLDCQLITRYESKRTGRKAFMVNPYIAHIGGIDQIGRAWGKFRDLLGAERVSPDTPGAGTEVFYEAEAA